jgi:hypothetical protein
MTTKPNFFEEQDDFTLGAGWSGFPAPSDFASRGRSLRTLVSYRWLTLVSWATLLLRATLGSSAGSAGQLSFFATLKYMSAS